MESEVAPGAQRGRRARGATRRLWYGAFLEREPAARADLRRSAHVTQARSPASTAFGTGSAPPPTSLSGPGVAGTRSCAESLPAHTGGIAHRRPPDHHPDQPARGRPIAGMDHAKVSYRPANFPPNSRARRTATGTLPRVRAVRRRGEIHAPGTRLVVPRSAVGLSQLQQQQPAPATAEHGRRATTLLVFLPFPFRHRRPNRRPNGDAARSW